MIQFRQMFLVLSLFAISALGAQGQESDTIQTYKKRVLETVEIDILSSYYMQDGDHAAVSGGKGSEELTDAAGGITISIPLNDDDILKIDASVSAYTSASSSNINPFDGSNPADPFVASSGASRQDIWSSFSVAYTHSSDDRNTIWSATPSLSVEYDYVSFGLGGSFTKLFNEKNTEIGLHGSVFLDTWSLLYPIELRAPNLSGDDEGKKFDINTYTITGNPNYNPSCTPIQDKGRSSYSVGVSMSQILSEKLQGLLVVDLVNQQGLLSTPFQRVYFGDVEDSFIENFHLADDIERLPSSRIKLAGGGRLNYYLSELFVVRIFYRYYFDDWGIKSHTASLEIPIKVSDQFTLYPSYRYYNQTGADYFAPYNEHLSTETYYTSDYDLSPYDANQYSFGITYTDLFSSAKLLFFGLKSLDLKYTYYERNTGFNAHLLSAGVKFVMD